MLILIKAFPFILLSAIIYMIGECYHGDVQLGGEKGDIVTRGYIDVCIGEEWTTVCDENWSTEDAEVVCKQLGFLQTGHTTVCDGVSI